jgi:hypothetical protein
MATVPALERLLEPLSHCLDAESARRVVDLQIDPGVQERIDILAGRANEGALSVDERIEYEALANTAEFIAILRLKAQRQLKQSAF